MVSANTKVVVGCKVLRADGSSLNAEHGRVNYPIGKWIGVPGNGAYIAVTGGLEAGGTGPLLAYFECAEPTGAVAPEGVICYRRVRRLADACPERVTPELRGRIARDAPDLTPEQRMALAAETTPELRGRIARDAPDLTPEQRMALAADTTPEWRGRIARDAPDLTPEQRMALAAETTPELRGWIARYAPDLTPEQRMALRDRS